VKRDLVLIDGRQALFRVPAELDREGVGRELEEFLMVRD